MQSTSGNIKDVEAEIAEVLSGQPSILFEAASYLISSGGKRLRPRLLLAFNRMFGGDRESAVRAAASIEMLHNFTLIHDDIMDKDETRHGVPTTHVKFGDAIAILAGDVLQSESQMEMARAAQVLPSQKARHLLGVHAHISTEIAKGQTMDMQFEGMRYEAFTPKLYFSMIRLKTAILFSHSCWVGAYLAGAQARSAKAAAAFGMDLGMAFQMADDILGLVGDPSVTGKPVGSDVRNGKKTMPILLAVRNARGQEREKLLSLLEKRDPSATDIIVKAGGIDATRDLMERYRLRAESQLSSLPDNGAREELKELLYSSLVREK